MVWSSPRPPESVYLHFYRSEYTEAVYGLQNTPESIAEVIAWRRRRSKEKIGYFPKLWKRGMRVLEIGAGIGAFLDVLRTKYGARVWGIEPSGTFVRFARSSFKIPMFQGTYESWRARRPSGWPRAYEAIVMDQILEHILNPVAFLQSLHAVLAPGGKIFISVPNIAQPKESKKKFYIFEHVSSFSPLPLCLLLWRCGFKPVAMHPERPGSLQIVAEPMHAPTPALPMSAWGNPLTRGDIESGFSKV